jgi:WD40 repeat protein
VSVRTSDPPQGASPIRRGRLSRGWRWTIGIAASLVVLVGGALGVLAITHPLSEWGDNTYLESAQFTPDGRLLLTTTGGQVRVWSVESGRSLETLEINGDGGEISPRGDLLAVSRWDTKVDLSSLKSGDRVRRLSGLHADSVSFSPDGRLLLVIGRDDRVRIVALPNGRLLHRFHAGDAGFSPDGRFLVTADGRRAEIRSLDTGRVRLTVRGKPGSIWLGGLSPDGRLLLTLGGYRGRLWDARSGRLLHTEHVAKNIDGYSELDGGVHRRRPQVAGLDRRVERALGRRERSQIRQLRR